MFNFSLDMPSGGSTLVTPTDVDTDDFTSLVISACEMLGATDCRFHMGGFGQDDWNLDVRYDMSSVVEQVPDVLAGLRAGVDAELDLYPQGVERSITFHVDGERIIANCISRTSWVPLTQVEQLARSYVVSAFEGFASSFARAVFVVSPELAITPPLDRWRDGVV